MFVLEVFFYKKKNVISMIFFKQFTYGLMISFMSFE